MKYYYTINGIGTRCFPEVNGAVIQQRQCNGYGSHFITIYRAHFTEKVKVSLLLADRLLEIARKSTLRIIKQLEKKPR